MNTAQTSLLVCRTGGRTGLLFWPDSGENLAPVYMKRIEWSIRSKTGADWDFRLNPLVFLYSIYMKRIEILSIQSTSNLKSILKSSRLTWVLRSDRLENVRAASCKGVKRIEDIDPHDYFLKTHACFTENKFSIGSTTQSSPCKHQPCWLDMTIRSSFRSDRSLNPLHVNRGLLLCIILLSFYIRIFDICLFQLKSYYVPRETPEWRVL